VRIVRNLGLIGLVAVSLLCSPGRSSEQPPRLYRAKPEDVPPWAKHRSRSRLKFRFQSEMTQGTAMHEEY
jgi:hypothetical protein